MSDRSSAEIFGEMFKYLARNPDDRAKEFAREMWKRGRHYDFSWSQMEANPALIKLGLAEKLKCGCIVYQGEKHRFCEGA